jgi:hypothetical protein
MSALMAHNVPTNPCVNAQWPVFGRGANLIWSTLPLAFIHRRRAKHVEGEEREHY